MVDERAKRLEAAASLGIRFRVCPSVSIEDGIHAARMFLGRCWFDAVRAERGVDCLRHYRKRYNDTLKEFTGTPVHDWASQGADAFRYLAARHTTPVEEEREPPPYRARGIWT